MTDIWYKSSALAIVEYALVEVNGGGRAVDGRAVSIVAVDPVFWHGCFARTDHSRRCRGDVGGRAGCANACLCAERGAWQRDHMGDVGLGAQVGTRQRWRVGPCTMYIIADGIVAIWSQIRRGNDTAQ